MPGEYKEDKTERATTRQRNRSRDQGNVAQSPEVNSVFLLLFGLLSLYFLSAYMYDGMKDVLRRYLSCIGTYSVSPDSFVSGIRDAVFTVILIIGPILGALILITMASSYVQCGWLFTTKTLKPKLSAIKPDLKKINFFKKENAVNLLVGVAKLSIVGFVAYKSIRKAIPEIIQVADTSVANITGFTAIMAFKLILKVSVLFIIAAVVDYIFKKHKHEESIKMTKQQVKDERKDLEGDPKVKGKIRQIQLQTAMQRMMKDAPEADVVITNPTHYAVALKYDKETMWAPKVVAKGARLIAERIKEIAKENGIPIVENKILTQALYKVAEVGKYIPAAFYHAVAEILAYVYNLRRDKQWV